MGTNSQALPIRWISLRFPMLWETDGETHSFPKWWSNPQDGNIMGKKAPILLEKYEYQFLPVSPYAMGLVAFSCAMENELWNPCISHMMNYIIGRESDKKKVPSMIPSFPDSPHIMCFVAFFCVIEKLWGNQCISHMLKDGNQIRKRCPYHGKSISTNFLVSSYAIGVVALSRAKTHTFPIWRDSLFFPVFPALHHFNQFRETLLYSFKKTVDDISIFIGFSKPFVVWKLNL